MKTRQFPTGATRDDDARKYDYEGILSPLVLKEYGRYMHAHRQQGDTLRPADNWQKGFPRDALMKSAYRHFLDWHTIHDGYTAVDFDGEEVELLEALSGVLFNTFAYMHSVLKGTSTIDFPIEPGKNHLSLRSPGEAIPTGPGYHEKMSK